MSSARKKFTVPLALLFLILLPSLISPIFPGRFVLTRREIHQQKLAAVTEINEGIARYRAAHGSFPTEMADLVWDGRRRHIRKDYSALHPDLVLDQNPSKEIVAARLK